MSGLVKWLATANPRLKGEWPAPKTDGLPNPNDEREESDAVVCAAANAEIELSMADGQSTSTSTSTSRKRASTYQHYNSKQRAKMAQYADTHGLQDSSRHFSRELGRNVPYTTTQSVRNEYRRQLGASKHMDASRIVSLPHLRRGRPFLIPASIHIRVRRHLLAIRRVGGVVNRKIAIATAIGTVRALQPSLLTEHDYKGMGGVCDATHEFRETQRHKSSKEVTSRI